jgi:hypothetical protein
MISGCWEGKFGSVCEAASELIRVARELDGWSDTEETGEKEEGKSEVS